MESQPIEITQLFSGQALSEAETKAAETEKTRAEAGRAAAEAERRGEALASQRRALDKALEQLATDPAERIAAVNRELAETKKRLQALRAPDGSPDGSYASGEGRLPLGMRLWLGLAPVQALVFAPVRGTVLMGQVHVLTGPERRRRFSLEEKRGILAAAFPDSRVDPAILGGGGDRCPYARLRRLSLPLADIVLTGARQADRTIVTSPAKAV